MAKVKASFQLEITFVPRHNNTRQIVSLKTAEDAERKGRADVEQFLNHTRSEFIKLRGDMSWGNISLEVLETD